MALPVIFKQGNESTMDNLAKSAGQLIVTSDGTNGKLWFDESDTNRINIVPNIIDCGLLDIGGRPMSTYDDDVIDLDENQDDDTNDNFIANGIVVHNVSCE